MKDWLRHAGRLAGGCVVGATLAFQTAAAWGAEALKAAYVEFPPYSFTEAGKPAGILLDMLAKISADTGVAFSYESAPARRLFQGLADGDYQVFTGIKTAEVLKGTTVASESVIARIELRAYSLNEAPSIKTKEDLAGKSVIVLTGYSYGGWRPYLEDPANKVQLVEARTAEQALAMLKSGRAPVLLQYAEPMAKALAAQPSPELKYSDVNALDIHLVISKKVAEPEKLLARLEGSYKKLRDGGAFN